ncbi:Receptor-like serine/threonine-protein kinase [Heracleum sosnowskyi]|uniref:Receptor-like serine/threonine-protein kinase n=1 Tax=Heracleum sosnowskyi TaxID=360622 RepID=A0AAD8MXT5_9APIA|nr:Receptor-like serine/threonine-protein kinase [Heracleum sosnowskyi]
MDAKESYIFMLISLFLCLFNIHLCFGAESISANQSLSGDETIVSSGGNYELGFFKPGNSSKYYIGIWYKKVSEQTVVWVANREKPVTNKNSSELKIVNGNLVLLDESQTRVWSTDTRSDFPNIEAVLFDEGNFVLRNGPSSILWQSLDYPTDTWLPGTKISFDKRTNKTKTLTSWKNSEDPSPGLYTLEVDPIGNQGVIMWNRSKWIWYSGYWDGEAFSRVPEMLNQNSYSLFNFSYTSNKNETSFSYSSIRTLSFISRLVIDNSGQIKLLSWLDKTNKWSFIWSEPKQQCEVSDVCGAYGICNQLALPFCNCLPAYKSRFEKSWILGDYSGGCVRNIELECGKSNPSNGGKDMFGKYSYIKLPNNSQPVSLVRSMTGCKSICLSNCSCSAYAYHDSACFTWRGDLFNMQQLSKENVDGKVIYIRLNSLEFSKESRKVVYAIVGGSSLVAVIILVGLILVWKSRRAGERAVEGTLMAFGYKDMQSATKNFSDRRNMEQTQDGKVNFFPARAATVTIDGGDILSILDPNLNHIADIEEVTRICRLACWCIQDDENARPSMSQIVQILEGVLEVNLPPDPRNFQLFLDMNNEEDIVFFTDKSPSLSLLMKSDPLWTSSLSNNSTSSGRS